ncbi:MAG: hypothetical protein LBH05_05105 [Deferribacteraceae bacterium]|jgi:hypothetical protein|nr:hypothetical protein [Deferribacteraceae bacterium]
MNKVVLLAAFTFAVTSSALVYANFVDHREFIHDITPYSFENTADLSALYPGSVTIFSKGQKLLWEASGIEDYKILDGEIAAITQNGVANLPHNLCGGLIVPDSTESIIYKNDLMVVSSYYVHNIYYVPDCAMYNQIPREGSYFDIAGRFLCEASYTDRVVRNIYNGAEIYRDQPRSPVQAVYGIGDVCYFIQSNGEIDAFNGASSLIEPFSYIYDLLYASSYQHGFSGFTKKSFFTVKITPHKAFEFNFYDLPQSGFCVPAYDSEEPFCSAYFEHGFTDMALKAERITLTYDSVLLKTGNKVAAYSRESGWTKELVTRYSLPKPCVFKDALYYRDPLGDEWQIDLNSMKDPVRVSYIPAGCNTGEAYYKDGGIYLSGGAFVYRYAELARHEGDKKLYRHKVDGGILYFNKW